MPEFNLLSKMPGFPALFLSASAVAAGSPPPLEEVVVTATRLERSQLDIAGTVSVITAQDIERTMVEDLDDLIRFQPGVTMSTASRGGNEGFVIRGIGGNRILTMIDGVRSSDMYAAGPSSYGKDVFETDDLKAVEIIRGPASVLYGADAMGGAVILRTKSAADYLALGDDDHLGVRASWNGENDQAKVGLTYAARLGEAGDLVAQYTRRQFGEQEVAGSGSRDPLDGENDDLMLKLGWQPSGAHRFELSVDAYREEIDTSLLSELSPTVTSSEGRDETERYRLGLDHRWSADAALLDEMATTVYWQDTDALQHTLQERISYSFINPANPATYGGTLAIRDTDFFFNQETYGIELQFDKTLEAGTLGNTLVYGVNYERTETERPRNRCETENATGAVTCSIAEFPFAPTEDFPNKTFPDTTTVRTGLYLQDEIVFGDSGFTLIPGIRYDHYAMDPTVDGLLDTDGFGYEVEDVRENELSLNLGAIHELTPSVSLFGQYAEGFRPPNFDEANQAFVNHAFGYALVPNPGLEAEKSQSFEVGLKSAFDNVQFNLTAYENRFEDFINTEMVGVDGGILLFQDSNIGEVSIHGVEARGMVRFSDAWGMQASMAWSRGDDDESNTPLNSVEPLTGVVGLDYGPTGSPWSAQLVLTAVDDKTRVAAPDGVQGEAYQLLDLFAQYEFAGGTGLEVGVFNVFDEEYARWANIQGLAASDTDLIADLREAGRHFRISLSHAF